MKDEGIESTLFESIAKSNIKDVAVDIAELSLDSFLKDGVIKDIPVIGSLFNLYSAGKSIRDEIFLRKIISFLLETQKTSEIDKEKFYKKLINDHAFKKRVGEVIILILDKIDDLEKPAILGKLFRCYMEGKINFELFHRFATIINNIFLTDLKRLPMFFGRIQFETYTSVSLEHEGLVYMYIQHPKKYRTTNLGVEFLKLNII